MPWKAETGLPQNMVYRKVYRGFNFCFLLTVADRFSSPFFLTFNQVKDLGGHVLKGERGFPVVFWKLLNMEEKDGSIGQVPFLRYYTVFNLKQTEGIDESKIPSTEAHDHDFDPIGQAEQLIEFWSDSPEIRLNQSHAFYSPSGDYIGMPNPRTFFQEEQYYNVYFMKLPIVRAISTGQGGMKSYRITNLVPVIFRLRFETIPVIGKK